MKSDALIDALNLPASSRVGQRVPKKLMLDNGAPTAADKRLINDGIEEIHWVAALKPATIGVPMYRDDTREYLEIAVLQMKLRPKAKTVRLAELLHRAVSYPVFLSIDDGTHVAVSLAHKRHALNEADKVVLEGEPVFASDIGTDPSMESAFLHALDIARQPRSTLFTLYQGWMDAVLAIQAAQVTGVFKLLDSAEQILARREALQSCIVLRAKIVELRRSAAKASQMARQIEFNLELKRIEAELANARAQL